MVSIDLNVPITSMSILLLQIIHRQPISNWTDDRISIAAERQISFPKNGSQQVIKLKLKLIS
jgi:hypothetical protein